MEDICPQTDGVHRAAITYIGMNRQINTLIAKVFMAIAFSACIPAAISAQEYDNTPVTISKEKVRIDGQVCYSHIVLEKQTLYSISKAYGVSIEDIYRYNPTVRDKGLKKNTILIIPAVAEDKAKKAEAETENETAAKENETIRIQKEDEARIQNETDKKVVSGRRTHTVKWYEDLDTIAAKYGVTAEEIILANNLKGRKLSKRMKLMIPLPGEFAATTEEEQAEEPAASPDTVAVADTASEAFGRSLFPGMISPDKEVSVSLLLPLNATGTTSSRQNMDFYSGVLMAVYDLAQEGISTSLDVIDIADGRLPSNPETFSDSDIVIGPVSAADLNRIRETAPEAKAVISPLDQRAADIARTWKPMIQAPTPHAVQYRDLVSWIQEDMVPGNRVLVISEKGARETDAVRDMKAAIDSSGIGYSPLSYSILEGRNVTESLEYLMTETSTNRVYIASESEAFVNDVVRNLNLMVYKKYDVVLYAPSKIRSFETIEVENFHNTSLHVSLAYYIDYDDTRVKEFLLKYRALFNAEPTQFAFQGYDIAKYFISQCSKYGYRWEEMLDSHPMQMLQSTFRFVSTEEGGHINNGVRRIIYDEGWSVKKVK